jgi:hypothetical protein
VTGVSAGDVGGNMANINGQRQDQVAFKLDGMLNMDMGNNSCCSSQVNVDMIGEIKVITNGATADMGTVGSSQVMVVTKSGSKEFHGNAYYYRRHESMNANSWTNNFNNVVRGRDRQNVVGFTLGGPLFIPKLFNTSKEKLFYFVSEEVWKNLTPNQTTATVPTQLERNGDFSQSYHVNNNTPVVLLDPNNVVNGVKQPLSGNFIPLSLRNADAQKFMNVMPLPNFTSSTTYQYNFKLQNSSNYNDKRTQGYKVDYNLSERWRLYMRYSRDYDEQGTPNGLGSFEFDSAGKTMGWNWRHRDAWNTVLNVTTIISPTMTNELFVGGNANKDHQDVDKVTYLRSTLGLIYGLPDPTLVPGGYAPRVTFTGADLPNSPNLGTQRPFFAINSDSQITDNFTKVMTRHTIKVGATFQIDRKDQNPWNGTTAVGAFQFGRDPSNNAADYDYQYANMLTGNFNTFQQIQKVVEGRYVFHQGEWYVMDTWKVRPNLTLDMGLRFAVYQPTYDSKGQQATFSRDLWNPNQVVKLYGYAAGGKAVDPTTGILYPGFLRGNIVPNSGDINNGFTVVGKNNVPAHLLPYTGIQYAPRIGVAWQPKFLPKTVIRVGGGVFKDRMQSNVGMDAQNSPPTSRTSTLQFGNVADVNSSLFTLISPPGISQSGYTGSGQIPTTYNWNFAVERELPYATLLSASYIGSVSRHLIYLNWINEPAYGAAWTAAAQDPTVTAKFDGTTTLPINFYRPYKGVGALNLYSSGGSNNYNALQVQLQKRMSRKLSYGVAYTWSKVMGIGDNMWSQSNPFGRTAYNYGRLNYDRTQMLSINFVYYMPKWGKNGNLLDHPGVRLALNDWELSGFMLAQTGTPAQFGYPSFNSPSGLNVNRYYTGQENFGPRPYIMGDWRLATKDEYHQFNTNAIQPAVIHGSVGLESGLGYWSNPNTFFSSPEITMMKNVPFSKDGRRYVQLRLETYNMLNHHDYTGRSMSPTFNSPTDLTLRNLPTGISTLTNPSTGAPIDGGRFGYGALSGAASPRRVQIAIKIYF